MAKDEAASTETRVPPVPADKHTGMKVDGRGMLHHTMDLLAEVDRMARSEPKLDDRSLEDLGLDATYYAEGLRQLADHLREVSDRFYAGEADVIDQFFQLYALDGSRPNEGRSDG